MPFIIFRSNNFACSQYWFKVLLLNMQHDIKVKTICIFADPCMKCAHYSDADHVPRMALQLALTTLESVAVMLNERKRESEQSAAFHAKLRNSGSKLAKSEAQRVLLREDTVQQLEFNSQGQVCRSKPRRLLLLNDQVRNFNNIFKKD